MESIINKKSTSKKRFFIPVLPPYLKQKFLQKILPFTDWIGLNLFEIRNSQLYSLAKKKGLKDALQIDDKTKVMLTTTEKDEKLIEFYGSDGIKSYKSDVADFDVDLAMGPDWFCYDYSPIWVRQKNIAKALKFNQQVIDLENIVPNIHGTTMREIQNFIKIFKSQGKNQFVLPGREYLINLGDRKQSQNKFFALTSNIVHAEKIDLIVTGCSSPKLQQRLADVAGFAGKGWLIQSKYRRLIQDMTYKRLFDLTYHCYDFDCCASFTKKELADSKNDSFRAIHNLKKIQRYLQTKTKYVQIKLVN